MPGLDMTDTYSHFKSLKHGACADAAHDFIKYKFNTARTPETKPGLPEVLQGLHTTGKSDVDAIPKGRVPKSVIIESLRHESTMLQELFKDIGLGFLIEPPPADQAVIMKQITDALYANPVFSNFYKHDFNLETINGQNSYSIKLLSKSMTVGAKPERNLKKIGSHLTTDDYIDFFGTNDLHVIIDAQTIGWNGMLKQAKNGTKMLQVTSLINREIVNDPATKTFSISEIRSGRDFDIEGNTLKLNIKYDACQADITYEHTKDDTLAETDLQRDKLFSIMDFRISPLKMKGKALPGISLDIISPTTGHVYQSDNPHVTNNITECWAGILELFKKVNSKRINSAAFFQCKRSGDWLQALACLDSKRLYLNMETGSVESIPSIKLITHDKVLLWYALFLGIDVLFTYKILPPGYSQTKVEDDDEPNDSAPDVPGSEKILLLFANNTKNETSEQREKRILTKADALVDKVLDKYKAYLATYNEWIQQLRTERQTVITSVFNAWLNKPATIKLIQDLLRAYWEFTAIDYKDMTSYYVEVTSAYTKYSESKSVDDAEAFIGACINFDSKMMAIKSIEDIRTNSNAYKNDSKYLNMVDLMVVLGRAQRAKGTLSNESKAFMTCEFLSSRLPSELLEDLKGKFKIISDKLQASDPSKIYVLYNFISKLNELTDEKEQAITAIAIQENANTLLEHLEGEGDTTEEFEQLISETTHQRKNVKSIVSPSVNEYASRIFEKASSTRGGGKRGRENDTIDTTSYMLCLCYLHELMNTLNGFDSHEDDDYLYYDALTRLVVSAFSLVQNDYNVLQAIFYDVLPEGEWNDGFLKPNFTKNLTTAADHVAHHSLTMREGVINSIGNEGRISLTMIANYQAITNKVKDMPFFERQTYLFKQLVDCINRPFIERPLRRKTVVPTFFSTGYSLSGQNAIGTIPLVPPVSGGTRHKRKNRKIKRRNGSPRRKTRRSTKSRC